MRLGGALEGLDGLESAHANLMGEVTLAWDDERVEREEIVAALDRAGFRRPRPEHSAGIRAGSRAFAC